MDQEIKYVGSMSQLMDVKTYRLEGGRAQGVKAADVTNQSGLSFTVVADRCMDITGVRYKGINISYLNACGVVHPSFYNEKGAEWLRNFTAGLLTTCGLDNIGSPCAENNQEYGLHGRIGNMPAEEFNIRILEEKGEQTAVLSGKIQQNVIFGEKLQLKREIRACQKRNRIDVYDEICNKGFKDEEYMILYHCNLGYPFISPSSEIRIDSKQVVARNEHSQEHMDRHAVMDLANQLDEMCYYHEMINHNGLSVAGVFQPDENIGLTIIYENHVLDHFVQWKNCSEGQYVLGLEPGSNYVDGKFTERSRDFIKSIPPQASVKYRLSFEFWDSREEFENAFNL